MPAGIDDHGHDAQPIYATGRRAFRVPSDTPTSTPAAIVFWRMPVRTGNALEADLFRCGYSDPLVSSGAAKAEVVVAIRRVVVVAVRRPHIARVVVPRHASDDAVRCTFTACLRNSR